MKKWNKFFYRNPKGVIDSDSAWKLQNQLAKSNDIYKMVNLSGGGTLIELYDEGGADEDVAMKAKRIKLYFDSYIKPNFIVEDWEILTKDMYQKWHNRQAYQFKQLEKEVEGNTIGKDVDAFSMVTIDSVLFPFHEHRLKWRLDKRGAVGETPLHLMFLNNSSKHISIAKILLDICPELVYDYYEGTEYYGEGCLHFAIIQDNLEAVELLLNTKILDLHARARGKFFLPVDVKRGDVILNKKQFQGYAYYGEYPLSFAASLGNHKVYDMLVDSGCDPTKRDRFGNNLLHLTVIHDQPDMFYYASNHGTSKADADLMNNDGLTPLALAAKLGKKEMFRKILNFSSRQYWSYNTVTCSAYPLKSFDTIDVNGETDWNSALMFIIRGKKESHLDMLSDGVVHHLLQCKWEKFARKKFLRLLLSFILHVLCLSVAVYLRPDDPRDLHYGSTPTDYARFVFEATTVAICVLVLFFIGREVFLEGFTGFYQNVSSIPARITYVFGCLLVITCVPFRFTDLTLTEDWLLMIATPGIWSYALFFLRNTSITGPFITTIYRMFRSDIVRFAVIYIIILITFALAFFVQFKGMNVENFTTFDDVLMTLLQQSFGEFNYENILQARYRELSIFLFVVFMLFVHVLLLNMLIAMMTQTFEKIKKLSEKIWRRQWASMIIVMERSHRNSEKRAFQDSYDLNINASRVSSEGQATDQVEDIAAYRDTRAIMVVETSLKSESQRRKAIQKSWKKAKRTASDITNKKQRQQQRQSVRKRNVVMDKFSSLVNMKAEVADVKSDNDSGGKMVDGLNIFRRKFSVSSNSSFSA